MNTRPSLVMAREWSVPRAAKVTFWSDWSGYGVIFVSSVPWPSLPPCPNLIVQLVDDYESSIPISIDGFFCNQCSMVFTHT